MKLFSRLGLPLLFACATLVVSSPSALAVDIGVCNAPYAININSITSVDVSATITSLTTPGAQMRIIYENNTTITPAHLSTPLVPAVLGFSMTTLSGLFPLGQYAWGVEITDAGGTILYTEPGPYCSFVVTASFSTNKTTLGSATRLVGDVITSTVVVTNNGGIPISGASIVDPIPVTPAGTTRSYTAVGTGAAAGFTAAGTGAVNDTSVSMDPGDTITYTILDTVTSAGTYTNTATATTPFNISASSGQTVTVNPNFAPVVSNPPDQISTNAIGSPMCSSFTVTDTTATPVSVSFSPPTGNGPLSVVPVLTDNGGGSWTLCYTPDEAGVNTFTVTATDSGSPALSASQDVVFTANAADPQVTKITSAGPYTVGVAITSTVTVSNPGSAVASGVVVSDPIPAPAGTTRSFTSIATGGATGNTASGTTAIADVLNLPIGATVVYTISDTPITTGTYQNVVTINAGPPVAGGPAGVVSSVPTISDPQITKSTAGGSPRLPGDLIVSTIVISNPAPGATATAVGLTFNDPIPVAPAGTTRAYTSVATGGATGNTASGSGAIADVVTLPVDATITYTVTDTLANPGNYQNIATLQGEPPAAGASITVGAASVPATVNDDDDCDEPDSKPRNLVAHCEVTDGQILLTWDRHQANNREVKIQYMGSDGTWSTKDGVEDDGRKVISGLNNKEQYQFRIAFENSCGRGEYSKIATTIPCAFPATGQHEITYSEWMAEAWNEIFSEFPVSD